MLIDKSIERPWTSGIGNRILQRAKKTLGKNKRLSKNQKMKDTLKESDFSIIASFCGGGTLYHDLGMKFLSPTVNLAFDGLDFVKFCSDLKKYLAMDLVEYKTDEVPYPVGRLDDVEIRFMHYQSFEEAKEKWNKRKQRVNFDKIFIMACDRDGMNSPECMELFDELPYKKVMYTAKEYPQYEWACYCPCFKKHSCVGVMTGYADFIGNKYYEKYFDIIEFLNSNI